MNDTDHLQLLQRTILANVAYGIVSTTPDGIVTSFNPAAERLLGYTADEVIGKQTPAPWHDAEEIERHAMLLSEELNETITPGFDVFVARPRRKQPEEGEWTIIRKDGGRIPVNLSVTALWDESGHITGFVGLIYDLTERKQAEKERMTYLHFFESMDRVNRAIQGVSDLEQMMRDVLDVVLLNFDCDRAFLMYPCDPEAASWRVPMERNRPEYPGASTQGLEIPMDADVARTLRELLASDRPVKFGPQTEHPLPDDVARQFGFLSFMSIAIYPRLGKPWQFGIHQCSYARLWTADEEKLLREIGRRLADGLTSLLFNRELRTSEQLFRAMVENSPDYIARYDLEFRRIYVNPAIRKLFGDAQEEVLGKTPTDRSPVYAPQVYIDRLRQVIDTGVECAAEIPFRTLRGEMHWGHIRFVPEFGAEGAVVSVLAIGRDIHEIKENELHFRMLAENFPDFVARFERDGRHIYVNPAVETAFGLTADTIVGKTSHELPGVRTPEQNDALLALIQRAFVEGIVNESEAHWSLPTGERIVEIRQVPEKDATGNVISVLCVAHDITERKQAEDQLRQSEQSLVESQRIAHLGSWHIDLVTNEVYWSEELYKMYGFDPALPPPLYTENKKLFTPESWERLSKVIARALETGISFELELELVPKDGGTKWILARGELVRGAGGAAVGLRGVVMDISERKQAEEEICQLNQTLEQRVIERTSELEVANQELEAFSYSVSHDLRTPLRAIDGFSHILLEDYADKLDDEGKRLFKVIRNNTNRMGQLIDDMLQFSRTARLEINYADIDMEQMAREVVEGLLPAVTGAKPEIEIEHLPLANGDSAMLRQVLVNLISNAFKFSRTNATPIIKVGATINDDETIFFIQDNGVGFSMQYADKLFGVFQRLHSVEEFEGTGIGLAIVKRIITRHGGRVWAEGKVNEGATIYFSLPQAGMS